MLIITGIVKIDSDTVKQCLFTLKSYDKILERLRGLLEKVGKAKNDEMIRINRLFSTEQIIRNITATDLQKELNFTIEPIEAKKLRETYEKNLKEIKDEQTKILFIGGNKTKIDELKKNNTEIINKINNITTVQLEKVGLDDKIKLFNNTAANDFTVMAKYLSRDLNLLGFLGYDIEVYKLKRDWTETIVACVLVFGTIAIGIMLLPAGGFAGVLAMSLITQSMQELIQIGISIHADIPVDLQQFVESKGMGLAVAIITAGIAEGLASIKGPDWAINNIAGFEAGGSVMGRVGGAAIDAVMMQGVAAVTQKIGEEAIELNDDSIKKDIKKAIEEVLESNREEVTKILLNDKYNNRFKGDASDKEMRKIVDKSLKIVGDYAKREMPRNIASSLSSKLGGAFGVIPGLVASSVDIGVGFFKSKEAVNKLKKELEGIIIQQAQTVIGTKNMMNEMLKEDFREDAKFIMDKITGDLLINGDIDIDYNNCNKYDKIDRNVTVICNKITDWRNEAIKDDIKSF